MMKNKLRSEELIDLIRKRLLNDEITVTHIEVSPILKDFVVNEIGDKTIPQPSVETVSISIQYDREIQDLPQDK